MADAQILEGQIQALEEAVLNTDERVDEIEEEQGTASDEAQAGTSSTPSGPIIDIAQTVGRLEAEVAECRTQISELRAENQALQSSISAALAVATMPLEEPGPELTVAEIIPEPAEEPGEEDQEEAKDSPNWLERVFLIR